MGSTIGHLYINKEFVPSASPPSSGLIWTKFGTLAEGTGGGAPGHMAEKMPPLVVNNGQTPETLLVRTAAGRSVNPEDASSGTTTGGGADVTSSSARRLRRPQLEKEAPDSWQPCSGEAFLRSDLVFEAAGEKGFWLMTFVRA